MTFSWSTLRRKQPHTQSPAQQGKKEEEEEEKEKEEEEEGRSKPLPPTWRAWSKNLAPAPAEATPLSQPSQPSQPSQSPQASQPSQLHPAQQHQSDAEASQTDCSPHSPNKEDRMPPNVQPQPQAVNFGPQGEDETPLKRAKKKALKPGTSADITSFFFIQRAAPTTRKLSSRLPPQPASAKGATSSSPSNSRSSAASSSAKGERAAAPHRLAPKTVKQRQMFMVSNVPLPPPSSSCSFLLTSF